MDIYTSSPLLISSLALFSIAEAYAQQSTPSIVNSDALTNTTTNSSSVALNTTSTNTSSPLPSPVQSDVSSQSQDGSPDNPSGSDVLVNYYFVFLALFLAVAALGCILMYRRKKRLQLVRRSSRQAALASDLNQWPSSQGRRRRQWRGRWRHTNQSRDEDGLNEDGEAPPPYMPKAPDDRPLSSSSTAPPPAIPLRALTREQVGLKPPAYSQTSDRITPQAVSSSNNNLDATPPTRPDV